MQQRCFYEMQQRCFYEEGVGVDRWERLRGGAFGFGLSYNVAQRLRFLVDNYEPGDVIFLLGFSRGAFTARRTGGFIRKRRDPPHRACRAD
jgi:uncharacterized protein (DUF2235 family)